MINHKILFLLAGILTFTGTLLLATSVFIHTSRRHHEDMLANIPYARTRLATMRLRAVLGIIFCSVAFLIAIAAHTVYIKIVEVNTQI